MRCRQLCSSRVGIACDISFLLGRTTGTVVDLCLRVSAGELRQRQEYQANHEYDFVCSSLWADLVHIAVIFHVESSGMHHVHVHSGCKLE